MHNQGMKDSGRNQAPELSMSTSTIVLHGTPLSGHTHRVELLLLMLGLPYRFETADAAIRRSPAFRALNPLGQIPVLQDGDLTLCDSNAILVYLVRRYAPGSNWLPDEPVAAARVQRWLSIAAGEVMYGPAVARMATLWNMPGDPERAGEIARRLLAFMDGHLAGRSFLAADHATIADLACYSYVAHAPEGRVPLDPYPAIRAWLARVEALPAFRPMPRTPLPEAA
jgi:glutathione S-transferase